MLRVLTSWLILIFSIVGSHFAAQAQSPAPPRTQDADSRAKANEWTVGLAAGLPEDTFLPFAAEIARNVNENGKMRVLPLATPGAENNIKDLLYLNGIDVALTNTDVLYYLKTTENLNQIDKRLRFISALYLSEVHLLVRPEIRSIEDLAGKKVGFNVIGAAPTISGPIIFERLNVKVEPVFVSHLEAVAMMRTGELAGLVHVVHKPNSLVTGLGSESGFKLLPIPYAKLEDLYIPAVITSADYPNLLRPGQKVYTVAVQAVLAVLDRTPSSDRTRRVRRFIELFFERFERFKGLGYQPAWKDVNLAAELPGWTRHEQAAEILQQMMKKSRAALPRSALMVPAEQERLFQRFLESLKQQPR